MSNTNSGGDGSAGGVGMGMIIGLLVVLLIVVAGGFYFFGGHSGGGGSSNPVAAAADGATHTVTGTVTAK